MQAIIPVQTQGHETRVGEFGFASNKHLNDWILNNQEALVQRQSFMEVADINSRDRRPFQKQVQSEHLEVFDDYERILEARLNSGIQTWRRDPYREEFVHEDIYRVQIN